MRKFWAILFVLSLSVAAQGQERRNMFSCMAERNILNHLDVGINVGTVGVGIDVALPVTDYARIRLGYNYVPRINFHSHFPIETRDGRSLASQLKDIDIEKEIQGAGFDIHNLPEGAQNYVTMFNQIRDDLSDDVTMGLKPNFSHFKFLVDVMPFKRNKHWSFTAGIFVGSSVVGEADNLERETKILQGVNAYNELYIQYANKGFDGEGTYLFWGGDMRNDTFFRRGVAGFPLGRFSDGEKAVMIPGEDATVHAEMEVSKVRPYVGLGYNTHLSRNKRWKLNVDAGVLILCGTPRVYVDNVYKIDDDELVLDVDNDYSYVSGMGFLSEYIPEFDPKIYDNRYYGDIVRFNDETWEYDYVGNLQNHVDLIHDLHDIPSGKVRDMVDLARKLKVYPNLSVTFSYRIF
jgi:hypothetical protein